jgi:hypothetical protein
VWYRNQDSPWYQRSAVSRTLVSRRRVLPGSQPGGHTTTPHDQLFKELLRVFFREFLELFFPEVAARLDFARVVFLDKEVFTDVPEGSRRELDLVAQVYTQDGTPELI